MGLFPHHFSPSNFLGQRLCVSAAFTSVLESQSSVTALSDFTHVGQATSPPKPQFF